MYSERAVKKWRQHCEEGIFARQKETDKSMLYRLCCRKEVKIADV